jgi:peroxiredoxin
LISIAKDSIQEMQQVAAEYGISGVPLLTDADGSVSEAYDVLKWAIDNGEPGHTFILIDSDGKVSWIQDYGAPDNPSRTMYVEPAELNQAIQTTLNLP